MGTKTCPRKCLSQTRPCDRGISPAMWKSDFLTARASHPGDVPSAGGLPPPPTPRTLSQREKWKLKGSPGKHIIKLKSVSMIESKVTITTWEHLFTAVTAVYRDPASRVSPSCVVRHSSSAMSVRPGRERVREWRTYRGCRRWNGSSGDRCRPCDRRPGVID